MHRRQRLLRKLTTAVFPPAPCSGAAYPSWNSDQTERRILIAK
jgi:hypothetical protein